jgi:MFS family permease
MDVFGLTVGSLFAERFVHGGRVKALYTALCIIMFGVPWQMWASAENLSIGRFICGFGSAICMVTSSIFMAETVPPKYLGIVGSAVNCGIVS